MHSSSIRSKAAFAPWLAALVFGAAANTGWLLHELRHEPTPAPTPTPVVVHLDLDSLHTPHQHALPLERTNTRARARRAIRHLPSPPRTHAPERDPEQLASWIERRATYSYTIDRHALDYVAPAGLLIDRPSLDALAQALDHSDPIELRNIQGNTPLWALGLRNGDRVLKMMTSGEQDIERVVLAVERRGRVVALSYELV